MASYHLLLWEWHLLSTFQIYSIRSAITWLSILDLFSSIMIAPHSIASPHPWSGMEKSVGQGPLDPTPTVLDAEPYVGSDDIQLTQVSCVPGPVDNSLTCARPRDPSPHLDYSTDYISYCFILCPHTPVLKYISFPLSCLHLQMASQATLEIPIP